MGRYYTGMRHCWIAPDFSSLLGQAKSVWAWCGRNCSLCCPRQLVEDSFCGVVFPQTLSSLLLWIYLCTVLAHVLPAFVNSSTTMSISGLQPVAGKVVLAVSISEDTSANDGATSICTIKTCKIFCINKHSTSHGSTRPPTRRNDITSPDKVRLDVFLPFRGCRFRVLWYMRAIWFRVL